MKKRTTIFRQLLYSVITPVILIIAGISIYNFFTERNQIVENRELHIDQLKTELRDFIDFFDQTILEFESDMSATARNISDTLVHKVFKSTQFIESANLDSIKLLLDMDENQDIYIVDRNGTVVNTTFEKDQGLNFFEIDTFFVAHFNKVWESGKFIEDRISLEMSTMTPKKYTYHSTIDKQYIVELGIYEEHSKNMVGHFTQKLNTIADKYDDIDTISVFFGTQKFINYQGHSITDSDEFSSANSTLKIKKETVVEKEIEGITYTTLFLFLDMEETVLHKGYIVRVKYNNRSEKAIIKESLIQFLWLQLVIVLPILFLIFWRAKVISKPITILLNKVDEIQKGKLDTKVPLLGNNEVTELSDHFNTMIAQLKDSYDNLEDKVRARTHELYEKGKQIEESHKEISDSIQYAKRLQDAILPSVEGIKKRIDNSFVYFNPKETVSGDFYWFEHYKGYDFIAAADCTGHGVPGALVSVVCNNALHQSLVEHDNMEPEKLLDSTREIIIDTFSKSKEGIQDGMDISLVRIDKANKLLKFSGANNPIWIVRKVDLLTTDELTHKSTIIIEDLALLEIKGSKQPVGLYEGIKPFESHEIAVLEGDTFYLFTDGYADQFGGLKNKKMMYKPFKRHLIRVSQLPMNKQKSELHNTLIEWKGTNEQVDDICIVGFKL
ncbi:MAG: sigma-B regulation protein RsbU (phosphoserine phosphatase) [Parvicella sp.]|jgi:sigma-B regulation protein RsbU (phosphoserine phosphatase)